MSVSDLTHTRGRKKKELDFDLVGELGETELEALNAPRPATVQISKIRDSHHTIARYIAQGLGGTEISRLTGYSVSRISILRTDPAFSELVNFYQGKMVDVRAKLDERLVDATGTALSVLQERLEDDPECFTNGELTDVLKVLADRSGYGPSKTNLNVNVGMAERLKAARQRVINTGKEEVIQD